MNPYFALVSGVFAVSTGAIFARLADAPAIVIAAYRVGLAVLVLLPFAFWKARDELTALSGKDFRIAVLAGFFLAMHFAAWISSLSYTSVANSVVLANTNPLWVGLLTPLISRESIRKTAVVSIAVSLVGGVIIGIGDFASGKTALWGDFLALTGSVCMAVYLLLGRTLRRKLSLLSYVTVCYGSAAVILWAIVWVSAKPVSGFDTRTRLSLLAVALIPQLIGHTSYNWALKWFSTPTIAVSLLGEPIGATVLAYIIFNEGLNVFKVIGALFILSAVYLAASGEK